MSEKEEIEEDPGAIGIVDYVILTLSLAIPFFISVWTAFKNRNTTKDFFTANGSMGPLPVAMSLISSFISGLVILIYSSEVYSYGLEYFNCTLGGIIGAMVFSYLNLKLFHDLNVSTIYEYIELRYKSLPLRIMLMLVDMPTYLIYLGVSLYAICLILASVVHLDLEILIPIVGVLCAAYSTIGGLRGVIWTDFFMMLVIIAGLLTVVIAGTLQLGPSEIWEIAHQGGRTKLFNFNPSLHQRQNFYLVVVANILGSGKTFGSSQYALQRAFSVKSFNHYKRVLAILIILYIFSHILMFASGIVVYATYAGCDPLNQGKIKKIDQIILYFVKDKLSNIPGIPGIFLAAMVCAGMSSLSSLISAFSNLVFSDLLCNISFFKNLSEGRSLLVSRLLSLSTAIPSIGLAFVLSNSEGILIFLSISFGIIAGPTIGVYFLAVLFPPAKLVSVVVGFFTSVGIVSWLSVGRIVNKVQHELLPLSTEFCNSSIHNTSAILAHLKYLNEKNVEETSSSDSIYDLSFLTYSCISPFICIFVAICLTLVIGSQKVDTVPQKYISPIARRFFYHKEEVQDTTPTVPNVDESCTTKL